VSGYVKNTAVQGNNEIVTLASGLGVGKYTVVIKDKNNQSASADFTITGRAPKISVGTLPEGTQGQAYSTDALSATGTSPMTWSIVSGSLPSGLTLDEKTGHISGTLAADAQTSKFTVKVTNAYGSDTKEVTITVKAKLKINDVTPPLATVGASYYLKLSVEGDSHVTWSLAGGRLPAGLQLNPNGTITGKVKPGAQTSTFTVQATDDQGNSATKDFTIEVTKQKIVNNVFATATVNSPYFALLKSPLAGDVTWDVVNGALPNGLDLEGNTIKGTPTKAGKFTFTLQASTDDAVLVNTYTIEVVSAVNKGHLKDVTVKTPYVNSIVDMTSKHYIGVYKDGSFHPNGTVSRGQFVSYLYQLLLDNKKIKPYYSKTSLFKDVPKNDPLSLQINTLAHYGYLPKGTAFHEAWGAEQWWIAQVMLNVLGVKYDAHNAYDALNQARFNGLWSLDATYRVNRAQVADVLEHIYTHVKKK
jgi:hypothetical protein